MKKKEKAKEKPENPEKVVAAAGHAGHGRRDNLIEACQTPKQPRATLNGRLEESREASRPVRASMVPS